MGAVEAPSGHCTDETFLPVDGLKQRLARAAATKGITEVADNVVTLVSHAVQVGGVCVEVWLLNTLELTTCYLHT